MNAVVIHVITRAFALLITLTGTRGLVRAVMWAALIVPASEAAAQPPAAQPPTADISANAIFRGCKALVEGQTANAQLYALGNMCAGIVLGLASVGQQLSL